MPALPIYPAGRLRPNFDHPLAIASKMPNYPSSSLFAGLSLLCFLVVGDWTIFQTADDSRGVGSLGCELLGTKEGFVLFVCGGDYGTRMSFPRENYKARFGNQLQDDICSSG